MELFVKIVHGIQVFILRDTLAINQLNSAAHQQPFLKWTTSLVLLGILSIQNVLKKDTCSKTFVFASIFVSYFFGGASILLENLVCFKGTKLAKFFLLFWKERLTSCSDS